LGPLLRACLLSPPAPSLTYEGSSSRSLKPAHRTKKLFHKIANKQADGAGAGAAGQKKDPVNPALLDDALKCTICFDLCERPVTAPCQHNYCLACFKSWAAKTAAKARCCPTCRAPVPAKFVDNPRINTALTAAIRLAKQGAADAAAGAARAAVQAARVPDKDRPDEAFTTDRAVRAGRANAASGRIMVTCPGDHFGPILPEHDPDRGLGVRVGDWWRDRLDCRQWGAHFPHVAGIAGQSGVGAQSVVLSGGYEDDRDEGEWFLYTGSGGRDLSGNKRTSKVQSHDQEFTNMNKALQLSCSRGLPVRVVRSFKERRSSYAPGIETPVRYDGLYRILRCWRKQGAQGKLVCRYLFVRCDNAPAPWSSGDQGDGPAPEELPAEALAEMRGAAGGKAYSMEPGPFWDYDADKGAWGWAKPPPASGKAGGAAAAAGGEARRLRKQASSHERLLRDFGCGICKKLMSGPVSTPCGHNFCHGCLDARYAAAEAAAATSAAKAAAVRDRPARHRRVPKPCPSCKADLCDFLASGGARVNNEMETLIARLQQAAEQARREAKELGKGEEGGGGGGAEEEEEGAAAAGEGEEEEEEEEGDEAGEEGGGKAEPMEEEETAAQQEDAGADKPSDDAAPDAKAAPSAAVAVAAAAAAVAAAPSAAAPSAAAGRYASELAQLRAAYPDFDESLMLGMLEDQGGDIEEVRAYLRRIKSQLSRSSKPAAGAKAAAAAEGAAGAAVAAAAADKPPAAASPARAPAAAVSATAAPGPPTTGKKKRGRPSKADKAAAAAAAKTAAAAAAKRPRGAAGAAAGDGGPAGAEQEDEDAGDVGAAADKAVAA